MIVDFRFLIEEEEFFTISNLQSPSYLEIHLSVERMKNGFRISIDNA